MNSILLATTNLGKLRELRSLFELPGLELLDPLTAGIELPVEESGATYAENARLKAMEYLRATGLWTIADDSGLEVEALAGRPGLRSARAGQDDRRRRQLLLRELAAYARPWKARFRCALVMAGPSGSIDIAEGEALGEIVPTERGSDGFGYDPIFVVEGTGKTMAELDLETKNRVSHRARAAHALLAAVRARLRIP